jgi:alpha-tubulin suppressor-like RCC1 family protein
MCPTILVSGTYITNVYAYVMADSNIYLDNLDILTLSRADYQNNPINNIAFIGVGASLTRALTNNKLYICGQGGFGCLGNNTTANTYIMSPVLNPAGTAPLFNCIYVSGGQNTTYAIDNVGTLYAWGRNQVGQCGVNTTTLQYNLPVKVLGVGGSGFLSNIVAVGFVQNNENANGTAYGLTSTGYIYSWGGNINGWLGIGSNTPTYSTTPVQMLDVTGSGYLSGIIDIGGGANVFRKANGTLYAVGSNSAGQLGIGNTTDSNRVVQVLNAAGTGPLTNIIQCCGAMALNSSGNVFMWGSNGSFRLGIGNSANRTLPVLVNGIGGGNLSNITAITGGGAFSLALTSSGNVVSWGYNVHGECGRGTKTDSTSGLAPGYVLNPSGVGNLSNITQIAAGNFYAMALSSTNVMYMWGVNQVGEFMINEPAFTDHTLPIIVTFTAT